MNRNPTTNSETSPWSSIRKSIRVLARQWDDVEEFSERTLQLIGELIGARSVILYIQDNRKDTKVIHAIMTRKGKFGWIMKVDDSDAFSHKNHTRRRQFPRYILKSCFGFTLALPKRWSGVLLVEYPGVKIVSQGQHQILEHVLNELAEGLHIVLMSQEVKNLESLLREREQANQELQKNMTDLTKEAYCVSSVITGLTQSIHVSEIFKRILNDTLPLLKPVSGHVYFPSSSEYINFKSSGSQYQFFDHGHPSSPLYLKDTRLPCLRAYFEKKLASFSGNNKDVSFNYLSLDDPSFSSLMRKWLQSLEIRSVLEFTLCSGNEVFVFGLIGFKQEAVGTNKSRLFKITLNMTSLFMENIALMKDLERQVKKKSRELLDMEKEQRFVLEQVGRPFPLSSTDLSAGSEQILEEIDHSQRAVFLGELASGVAHQIRNPLNHLVGVLHLIKNRDTVGVEETEQLLQEVTGRVETIHRMINKFIHYTRIPELNLTSESINDVLKNSLRGFRGQIKQASVEVDTEFDDRLSTTKIDLYLMDQVYHNIIKNALDAIGKNGRLMITTKKLAVKHGPYPRLEFVDVQFQDDGPGIPEEDISKVLLPFFSRKEDGIGLGLAIVNHVVGLHGGAVQVKNRPNSGANVRLCLPIR